MESNDAFRHLDYLTAEIAKDLTSMNVDLKHDEKGEVDMCVAIAEMKEEAKLEGKQEMLFLLYQKGYLSLDEAVENSGMRKQEFQTAYEIYFSEANHEN